VLRVVGLAACSLVLAGLVYERVGEWRDAKALPRIGRAVDVGGRTLNLYCSGTGSPTVIFESNGGTPGFRWARIQRDVAGTTRACWYDRAGLGWSDPGPFPNHSESVAHDLHRLLVAAGEAPPYLLVGHAMGGFHVRVYRAFYPGETAGMVLVDPMNEDMTINIHNHNELFRPTVLLILRGVTGVGFLRLIRHAPGPPQYGWSVADWRTLMKLYSLRKARLAATQELPIWVNGELARAGGVTRASYGPVPMTVLSAGVQDQEEDQKLDHDHALKLQLHERLARLSSVGEHTIVQSGHDIPDQSPSSVVSAITEMVRCIRMACPK
jgi:pimeloyl-ACP methyl ester carboxylesterase